MKKWDKLQADIKEITKKFETCSSKEALDLFPVLEDLLIMRDPIIKETERRVRGN